MTLGVKTAMRSWAHRRVRRAWQHRGLLARLLYPLHLLHRLWRGGRALAWRLGVARPVRLPVPVIVVGNLRVGGTGKTPLVIALVEALRERGWTPGVISRGYGVRRGEALLVEGDVGAAQCGDEPLLIRYATSAPVAVGAQRVAAARLLLARHAQCDVLIADDGLQHRRLGRDVEIAVVDSAGMGNGWLLPAGPLRDPPGRLASVDAVVLHGAVPAVRLYSPFYRMFTHVHDLNSLTTPLRRSTLPALVQEQREAGLRVLAICALGAPERFFAQLREFGLRFEARALPDHDLIDAGMLPERRYDRVLMTEKDAVKCHRDPRLGRDERIWIVPLQCQLDPGLVDFVLARLEELPHGPEAA